MKALNKITCVKRAITVVGLVMLIAGGLAISSYAAQVGSADTPTPDLEGIEGTEILDLNIDEIKVQIEDVEGAERISIQGTKTIETMQFEGVTLFGSVHVGPDEVYDEDVVIFGGTGIIEGHVTGSVVVFGGHASISGTVEEDLVMFGGTVALEPTAKVNGSLVTIGGVVDSKEGAIIDDDMVVIGGSGIGIPHEHVSPDLGFLGAGFKMVILFTWLVVGFLITLLFTRPVESTAMVARDKTFQSLLAGFLFHVATLLIITALTVILIGIPLAMIGGFIWLGVCAFGTIVGFVFMGQLILEKMGRGQTHPVLVLLLGFFILSIIRLLPFFLGWTLWVIWGLIGIGATIISRFGSNKPWFGNGSRRRRLAPVPPVPPGGTGFGPVDSPADRPEGGYPDDRYPVTNATPKVEPMMILEDPSQVPQVDPVDPAAPADPMEPLNPAPPVPPVEPDDEDTRA